MHARYAVHCGIRSDEMTLVMLRASPQEEGSCQDDVVCFYNTTVETFVQKQKSMPSCCNGINKTARKARC